MAEITAEAVRALRERTDLPMMECKKALVEANGDQERAVQILKEKVKGLKDKVADRTTSEGRVATLTAADGKSAVMVEVQCESAPVAKGDDFRVKIKTKAYLERLKEVYKDGWKNFWE